MKATVLLFDTMREAMLQAQRDFIHRTHLWVGYTYRLTEKAVHLVPPEDSGIEYIYVPRREAEQHLLKLPENTLIVSGPQESRRQ
ncbi:MAG: hypothetical protein JRH20_18260 [Deltaproteobacteria bacterium]|nr:hypothetical protein [Deltaproteobacteria bacterium]